MKTLRWMVIAAVHAATAFAATQAPAAAQEKNWKGELVVYVKPAKDVRFGDVVGGKQVYFAFSGRWPLQVRDDREGWLRIHDGEREGWADKADFILSKGATDYFTGRIKTNGGDAFAWYMRGTVSLAADEYDSAIKDFTEHIRLEPKG